MIVTMRMETKEEKDEFFRLFPQLYYRLGALMDKLILYEDFGMIEGMLNSQYDRSGHPLLVAATFEREKAEKYEAQMVRYFSSMSTKSLPYPKFAIKVTIKFYDGDTEEFNAPYPKYEYNEIDAFCKAVSRRADEVWRKNMRYRYM